MYGQYGTMLSLATQVIKFLQNHKNIIRHA
jgi:hypothetical protein